MALRVGLYLALLVVLVQGQRIAERKCKEYQKSIVKEDYSIPLILNPTPIAHTSYNCSKAVDLIVGGEVAKKNEFPHQALLGWRQSEVLESYEFKCGGSLISKRYVLTAPHCFKKTYPDIVRLGEQNLDDDTDNQVDFGIESFQLHPNYRFSASYHDIALIKLKDDVRFSPAIRPACLWTEQSINVSSVIATGFGRVESFSAASGSNLLRKVVLDFMNRKLCAQQFMSLTRIFRNGLIDEQLCIGSKLGGRDTCQGDSGGPVQTILDPKGCTYHVIGVTSHGPPSCGDAPGLYTKVSAYLDWIEEIVWKNE